jgi:hypothetical protein
MSTEKSQAAAVTEAEIASVGEASTLGLESVGEASEVWPHLVENDWVLNRLSEADMAARFANAGLPQPEKP